MGHRRHERSHFIVLKVHYGLAYLWHDRHRQSHTQKRAEPMACKQPFGISLYCEPVIEINCQPPVPGQIGGAVSGCFAQQLKIVDSDYIIIVVAKLQTGSGGILKAIENGLHHLAMRPGGCSTITT